jgi:hypothetical protein
LTTTKRRPSRALLPKASRASASPAPPFSTKHVFFSVNDPAADGTCCSRLHAAALPCHWLHPIRFKQAKRRRRWPNRVACAWHCGRG